MSRPKVETARAREVQQGDREAWTALVRDHWDLVHELHRLATQDDEAAASLTAATFEMAHRDLDGFLRDDETFSQWIASTARDAARRHLAEEDWKLTPWAQGQEQLSDPPSVEALGDEALHEGERIELEVLDPCLAPLSPGHRLVTRLLFRAKLSVGRVAGILGASSAFVGSFAYGLLDQLGGLEGLEFDGEDATPNLLLALEVLEVRDDRRAVKDLLVANQGCQGAQTLIFRVLRLSDALGRDPPAPATPADDVLVGLAALVAVAGEVAPGAEGAAEAAPEAQRIIPLKARPQPPPRSGRMAQAAFAGGILMLFVGGTFALLDEPETAPALREVEAARLRDRKDERRRQGERGPIGYYAGISGRKKLLKEGQTLHASSLGSTALTLMSGARAVLTGGSTLTAHPDRIELSGGRALIFVDRKGGQAGRFEVRAGGATLGAEAGTVAATTRAGEGTVLAVKGGSAEVRLPSGESVTLDPFRQVRIQADGSYVVEDAGSEAFSEQGGGNLPGRSGAAGSGTSARGGSAGGRGGAGGPGGAGWTQSSGSAPSPAATGRWSTGGRGQAGGSAGYGVGSSHGGGGSPRDSGGGDSRPGGQPDNGVMTPGGHGRPGTIRGFRDAF